MGDDPSLGDFLRSKAGNGWIKFLCFSVVLSIATGFGLYGLDVPASPFFYNARLQAVSLGGALFVVLAGIGFYISCLHFRQLRERETTQTLLKQSEGRFRDFAESASDWFWEQDENLRFTFVSHAVKEKADLAAAAHIGKTPRELISGVSDAQWQAHDAEIAARRPIRDFQFQRLAPDGSAHHFSISGRPYFDAGGRFCGYRGTSREITREVMAEIELERRVAARTAELHAVQAELLRKERLATLGQLTATVSHELRNPLGVIRNTIFTVAEMTKANGLKLERPLARIERSIGRCDSIITELLDYTRIRELKREALAVDAWLCEVLDEQKIAEPITLVREFGAAGQLVAFDPDRLRRVIINLVDNAAQAIEEGRVKGTNSGGERITLRSRAAEGRIVIEVEDTGPGIPPEVFARVFEPLFSTKGFGVGLGLPTVKQIIEHHGGSIEMTSQPGQGTRVAFWLPIAEAKDIAA